MKTIWKYKWSEEVDLPLGAKIFSAGYQDDQLMLWAMVDHNEKIKEKRKLLLLPTGHVGIDTDIGLKFITTVFQDQFVWHLFEIDEIDHYHEVSEINK